MESGQSSSAASAPEARGCWVRTSQRWNGGGPSQAGSNDFRRGLRSGALLRHQLKQPCCHQTVLVISNRSDAGGLRHAKENLVQHSVVPIPPGQDPEARRLQHEREVHQLLVASNVELVVLSGYMRILSPWFVERWKGRLVNIHPSLLPSFPGAHAHRDVLAAGVEITGCTVHLVDEGVDTGPILAQQSVEVTSDDTEDTLQERVKQAEHELYPKTLDLLCSGQITL